MLAGVVHTDRRHTHLYSCVTLGHGHARILLGGKAYCTCASI